MTIAGDTLLKEMMKAATQKRQTDVLSELPEDCVRDVRKIIDNAESYKGVLGVALTSLAYKILNPRQDIRNHQNGMKGGYSGRTFDTKYTTPFLKEHFSHFAPAESAWLTRSLEQRHSYNLKYPGRIRNQEVKMAFLRILDCVQKTSGIADKLLLAFLSLMLETKREEKHLLAGAAITGDVAISRITEAVSEHIGYPYGKGATGGARIPVLAIYSVYRLLLPAVKRYSRKTLAPLESHTSPDFRSHSVGDIEVLNSDKTCFEAVEVKHNKPITPDMVDVVYRKIREIPVNRYYILTTHTPNCEDYDKVMQVIAGYQKKHPCQIIVNGVLPSLKYYLRLVDNPSDFVDIYTQLLQSEYQAASGIKKEHLAVWQKIQATL